MNRTATVVWVTDFSGWGGGEQTSVECLCALAARGWRVELWTPPGVLRDQAEGAGLRVREILSTRSTALNRAFTEVDPALLHLVSYGPLTQAVSSLAHQKQLPFVLTISASGFPGGFRSRRFVRRAAGVVAPSRSVAKDIRQRSGVTKVEILLPIPDSYLSKNVKRQPFAEDQDNGAVVGWVGRLDPVKRLGDALAAFSKFHAAVPFAELRVACGQSNYDTQSTSDYVKRLAHLMQCPGMADAITFHADLDDVFGFLEGIDIFLSSSSRETFSRTLFEAMLMERPIVTTRAGGMTDLITDAVHGLLVDVGDVQGLADGLLALSKDRQWAVQLGMTARQQALAIAADHSPIEQLEHMYRTVVNS